MFEKQLFLGKLTKLSNTFRKQLLGKVDKTIQLLLNDFEKSTNLP